MRKGGNLSCLTRLTRMTHLTHLRELARLSRKFYRSPRGGTEKRGPANHANGRKCFSVLVSVQSACSGLEQPTAPPRLYPLDCGIYDPRSTCYFLRREDLFISSNRIFRKNTRTASSQPSGGLRGKQSPLTELELVCIYTTWRNSEI